MAEVSRIPPVGTPANKKAEVLRIPPGGGTPRGRSGSDEADATLVVDSGSKLPASEGRRSSTSKKANRRLQLESSRNSGDPYVH